MISTICVAGAGTMGSGIALAAAQNNFKVVLFDINPATIEAAKKIIDANLRFLTDKQKITAENGARILSNIVFSTAIADCVADLVIEAIIENLAAKVDLFSKFALINSGACIFASNTSSLSINSLQQQVQNPERVIGMHFFNPAHIMKLVEVVKGAATNDETINTIFSLCFSLQKTPVLCNDAPGFIVNRIARHYYLEAMYLVEKNIATIEMVDHVMENAGFKMGPFKLMDLIGLDINYAVSESIYAAFSNAERFRPSAIQHSKVVAGELGKKTGKGFYNYKSS